MKNFTSIVLFFFCTIAWAQKPLSYKVDRTKIKLGEEIILTIETKTDTLTSVVFPDVQNFGIGELRYIAD